jgi:hypothetical protein
MIRYAAISPALRLSEFPSQYRFKLDQLHTIPWEGDCNPPSNMAIENVRFPGTKSLISDYCGLTAGDLHTVLLLRARVIS